MKSGEKFMLAVMLSSGFFVGRAWSSTFRPMPLSKLVEQSTSVVVATPVSFSSHWTTMGSTSRVVTDVTLEVAWTLRGNDSTGQDIVVRTLGGTVGGIAHLVHGEATLRAGQTCLLFLVPSRDGALHVLGMAQGHYPLQVDSRGDWRVVPSPGLDGVVNPESSAPQILSGRRLLEIPALLDTQENAP
jgi:hypothetical protein